MADKPVAITVSVDFTGVTVPAPNTKWPDKLPACTVTPYDLEVKEQSRLVWTLSSPNVPHGYTLVFGTPSKERVEPIAFAKDPDPAKGTTVWTGDTPSRENDTQVSVSDTDKQKGRLEYTVWYLLVDENGGRTAPVPYDPDIQNKG